MLYLLSDNGSKDRMDISITYCMQWSYGDRAASLADEIEKALSLKAEIIGGQGGVFDVVVDGETIFSKHQLKRFPGPDEIISILRKRSA